MKYLLYTCYIPEQDSCVEMIPMLGLCYHRDCECAYVGTSDCFSDIYIPMNYQNYLELVRAFKTSDTVEIVDYVGFNNPDDLSDDGSDGEDLDSAEFNRLLAIVKEANTFKGFRLDVK